MSLFTPSNAMDPSLKVSCYNSHGFGASKPYMHNLLQNFDVLGVSEHWQSGPELYKLDNLADSCDKSCVSKCSEKLWHGPPERGRGYGGVALFWDSKIPAAPITCINSDRIVGIRIKRNVNDLCIFNVYMPRTSENNGADFEDVVDKIELLLAENFKDCKCIVMGDFNCNPGSDGGPRGEGTGSRLSRFLLNALYNENHQLICCDMLSLACGPTFTFDMPGIGRSWIDHVFVSVGLINDVML